MICLVVQTTMLTLSCAKPFVEQILHANVCIIVLIINIAGKNLSVKMKMLDIRMQVFGLQRKGIP
jgi:hypothetical protein